MMQQQQESGGLNRALRRLQEREAKAAPRRRREPKPIAANQVQVAKARASRLTTTERDELLRPAREGFTALREGVATWLQWVHVNTAITIAMAIEDQGVIRGMREHFDAADRAIEAVCKRVQEADSGPSWGRRTTLYFDEISALRVAIHLHDEQLQVLSAAELQAATQLAMRKVRAAGGTVMREPAKEQSQPMQEQLL